MTAVEGGSTVVSIKRARESVESLRAALEEVCYRVGIGLIVDMLTVVDRLTNARTNLAQEQLSYALALVQFRQDCRPESAGLVYHAAFRQSLGSGSL